MSDDNEFESAYSEEGFWDKLGRYAKKAGSEVVEKALLLYYAAQNKAAPTWARGTIIAALGYFIVPLDAVADFTPGIGYTDDLGVLALAVTVVAVYINDEVREKTAKKMSSWFGIDGEVIDVEIIDADVIDTQDTAKPRIGKD